jgi:ceramide synthetase
MEATRDVYLVIKDWFWSKSFWLPPDSTWDDIKRNETVFYPDANDMFIPIPLAVLLFVARLLWERFIALPVGRYYKLRETVAKPPEQNEVLERLFRHHRKMLPNEKIVEDVARQLNWTPRQVERWWRQRKVQGKHSEMQRFRETSWRFIFYFMAFCLGLYTLLDKPWFWDTKHCWYNYPQQPVNADIWWYYMLELSFYWSLVLSLFMDIKRKDFTEMIVHHIATITLMAMSWSANMVRVGTLVLVVHDAVDYILEFAKMMKYCRYNKFCDYLFVLFAIVFFVTRLVIYPVWILRSTLFEATTIVGMAPIYYAYNGLLCILQLLHIFWFYTIVRMAVRFIVSGEVEKDARSDTEVDISDDERDATVAETLNANGKVSGVVTKQKQVRKRHT